MKKKGEFFCFFGDYLHVFVAIEGCLSRSKSEGSIGDMLQADQNQKSIGKDRFDSLSLFLSLSPLSLSGSPIVAP